MTQVQDPIQSSQSNGQAVPETPVQAVPEASVQLVPESPVQPAPEASVQPVPVQEKSFLDSMIDKGASAVASMTGQPDPFTGQANANVVTTPASNAQPPESQPGFFGKLR
ncbi:MAG: hypothetical protein LBG59_00935 [Candidatus Peribacteria bacterium]|nr:hypothetical protein [Candidatus Peribacteria bacterium]